MNALGNYFNDLNDIRIYNVGIYLRLSKEDEITGQSESITNQRDFLTTYVLDQGWNIFDVYIDDGYSGLNFDRPDFKRMISDIENKKVDLVITKDLSRLGRDYIDTGYYIERYFPQKNIRYIALNDGIDTFAKSANNDMSPFKSVINDMYAKDISKKVRAVMDTKRKNGQFIGSFAPYGYKKDPANKNNFIIDEEVAPIVRRIFNSYINGESMNSIKKKLNDEKIPCPAKYKSTTSTYRNVMIKRYLWGHETIKRILTNPSYMGNMTQRRQEKINYKLDKFRKIPRKDWIMATDTHEPIISPEDFAIVQELIKKRIVHYDNCKGASHLLNGLVYCADCGAKMTYRRNCTKKMITFCTTYAKHGPTECSSHVIQEVVLENHVINELKAISNYILNDEFFDQFDKIEPSKDDSVDKELEGINKKLVETKSIIKSLYIDKVKGIIDEEMFLHMSKEYNEEKERLGKRYSELLQKKKDMESPDNTTNYMDLIKKIANFEIPDKRILSELIERIEITKEKEIKILYKFQSPYK